MRQLAGIVLFFTLASCAGSGASSGSGAGAANGGAGTSSAAGGAAGMHPGGASTAGASTAGASTAGSASTSDAGAASSVSSFELSPTVGGENLPFSVGLAFHAGDVPTQFVLDVPDAQVEIKRRWNDGSVKHAIVSGHVDLTASQAKTLHVRPGSAYPDRPKLQCSDIQSAAPQASVALGVLGAVELSSLLATPVRTWLSGPEAVECHYRGKVGSDATLRVQYQVRLYRGGRVFIRASVENGYLDLDTVNKAYAPVVKIDNQVVFSGGSSFKHPAHTRWFAEGWKGGDPRVVPRHDVQALVRSLLLPNYRRRPAAPAALDALYKTYQPLEHGGWTPNMGETGFQEQIGLLPNWDALYVTSNADPRAFYASQANAQALNSYPIVWRDSADDDIAHPSARPTWTVNGEDGGGETSVSAGALSWDNAHHGSGGYLAYLITGDYLYLETMAMQASLAYLIITSAQGAGTARVLTGQTRAMAWANRTVGQYAALAPLDPVSEDFRTLLATNAEHWQQVVQGLSSKHLGLVYSYELADSGYGDGVLSPWQENFLTQVFGHVSDLEPLPDMTRWNAVRDYAYQFPVGLLGPGGADGYCFTKASGYTLKVADVVTDDLQLTYASWPTVYAKTFAAAACGNALEGDSGGAPEAAATGYWGNLMPAIAYAVDHRAPGAAAAWARLMGATNYAAVEASAFDEVAAWGVVPR